MYYDNNHLRLNVYISLTTTIVGVSKHPMTWSILIFLGQTLLQDAILCGYKVNHLHLVVEIKELWHGTTSSTLIIMAYHDYVISQSNYYIWIFLTHVFLNP